MSNLSFVKFFVVAVSLLTVGCASGPKVVFSKVQPNQEDLLIKRAGAGGEIFVIPKSKLLISSSTLKTKVADPKGKAVDSSEAQEIGKDNISAKVVPDEAGTRFSVVPVSGFWGRTQLQIAKIPNTDIPQTVGSTFTDLTKSRIEQIGGIASSAISVFGVLLAPKLDCSAAEPLVDFVISVGEEVTAPAPVPGNPCWVYTLAYESPNSPVGAVTMTKFASQLGLEVGYFPVPACRDVSVQIRRAENPAPGTRQLTVSIAARVADPSYVRLVPLPIKGSIKMHPVCGADVSDEGSIDRFAQFNEALAAAMAQVKAIEEKLKVKE